MANVIYADQTYTNWFGIDLPDEGFRSVTLLEPLLRIGISTDPVKVGTADKPLVNIDADTDLATGNVNVVNIELAPGTATASTFEVLHVGLTSDVVLGNWASAILAIVDFSNAATGRVGGMAAAVTGEMHLPNKAGVATGAYFSLDAEIIFPTSTTIGGGTHAGFLYLAASGAGVGDFDDNGVLFELSGVTSGSTHMWYDHDGTAGGDTIGEWIKVRTPSGIRYIGLSDAQH